MPAGTQLQQRDTVMVGDAQWARVGMGELRMRHFVRTPKYPGHKAQYWGPSRQLNYAPCCIHGLNGFGSRPVTTEDVSCRHRQRRGRRMVIGVKVFTLFVKVSYFKNHKKS
jgi:hypothetical protein